MKNHTQTMLKQIAGVALIVLGILGLFLPFLQGIAFIVVGAILLDNKYILKRVRKVQAYFRRKWKRKKR